MDNSFTHGVGLVFYFFLCWLFFRLAGASWGWRSAKPGWIALVNTPFMRRIGIRWISAIGLVAVALQIALVVGMLGISAWTGRPITFD